MIFIEEVSPSLLNEINILKCPLDFLALLSQSYTYIFMYFLILFQQHLYSSNFKCLLSGRVPYNAARP